MSAEALTAAALAGLAAALAVSPGGAALRTAAVTAQQRSSRSRAGLAGAVSYDAGLAPGDETPGSVGAGVSPWRARAAVALAALSVVWLVGGAVGVAVGAGLAVALPRLLNRLPDRRAAARDRDLIEELPAALDLMAACLTAGCSLDLAVATTAEALDGPLAAALRDVASARRVGAPAGRAWARLSGPAPVPEVARAIGRAAETGVALADTLSTLAAEQRRLARVTGQARARRAGVLAVAPLGLCFLPAFGLLGVVPVVVGLAQHVLG